MSIQKPNWTPGELNQNYKRWQQLIHQTADHEADCVCDSCIEEYRLDALMEFFTDDEQVTAAQSE